MNLMKTPPKRSKMTQAALSRKLGISAKLVAAHVRTEEAPPLDDVAAWEKLLAMKGRDGAAPADLRRKIGEARLAILEEQKIAARRENQIKAGEMMLTADAHREACEAMSLTFAELERRDRELPPALAGLDAVSIFKRMKSDTEQIRKTLKAKFEDVGA